MSDKSSSRAIAQNIAAHNRVAGEYERRHTEIFNDIEQARLAASLREAFDAVRTGSRPTHALDFGCGSGNLTRHLRALGCEVTSADVARKFLENLEAEFGAGNGVTTHLLNGEDLAGLGDAVFDFAAAYSVLHHVPDYLGIVAELARVLRPGGVLYIDHEVAPAHWNPTGTLAEYRRLATPPAPTAPGPARFFKPSTYVRKLRSWLDPAERRRRRMKRLDPRWREEGDIHVWPDDHIEWDRIETVLGGAGFDVVFRRDYLHYDARVPRALWKAYEERCADMRVLVMRKE